MSEMVERAGVALYASFPAKFNVGLGLVNLIVGFIAASHGSAWIALELGFLSAASLGVAAVLVLGPMVARKALASDREEQQ
jgi:hypothetical protein